jgi:hypothetical protein
MSPISKNKENQLEKSPVELLMLNRILNKVSLIERQVSNIQENQMRRFNEVDEYIDHLQWELQKMKKERISLKTLKNTMEIVINKCFIKKTEKS